MQLRMRHISSASFLFALFCFLLPFVTLSCPGASITFSGAQLVTGTTVEVPQMFGEAQQQKFDSEPLAVLAFLCALSWAAGTVYMKAVRIQGDLLAITMWQIVVGVVVFGICYLIFRGPPSFEALQLRTWLGVFYSGFFGTALAYFIWYNIIGKVSTATASLGTLANPAIGVIGSVILLGERLTASDVIGFALIFAAAACVLLQPRQRSARRAT